MDLSKTKISYPSPVLPAGLFFYSTRLLKHCLKRSAWDQSAPTDFEMRDFTSPHSPISSHPINAQSLRNFINSVSFWNT
jgi:hypothetical protein